MVLSSKDHKFSIPNRRLLFDASLSIPHLADLVWPSISPAIGARFGGKCELFAICRHFPIKIHLGD